MGTLIRTVCQIALTPNSRFYAEPETDWQEEEEQVASGPEAENGGAPAQRKHCSATDVLWTVRKSPMVAPY